MDARRGWRLAETSTASVLHARSGETRIAKRTKAARGKMLGLLWIFAALGLWTLSCLAFTGVIKADWGPPGSLPLAPSPPLPPFSASRYMHVTLTKHDLLTPGCVGWRRTVNLAESIQQLLPCDTPISSVHLISGGKCECSSMDLEIDTAMLVIINRRLGIPDYSSVGVFSCRTACAAEYKVQTCLARTPPGASLSGFSHALGALPATARLSANLTGEQSNALHNLWSEYEIAFRRAGALDVVAPLGRREFGGRREHDWVVRGEHIASDKLQEARRQWKTFLGLSPQYPEKAFRGRGIVMTGGGTRFMIPAYVAIGMIRRSGCTLPIELWFFDVEMPDGEMRAVLEAMGVTVRNVDEITPGASTEIFKNGLDGFGYVMKVAVLLFSSFEQALYIDSDNVALEDVTDLFEYPGFKRTGMLLWPDYWKSTVAPDFFTIAPEARSWEGSVETGQLLVNKRLCWAAMQLVLFLNLQGSLYFTLLTNYMGTGDKETFPAAMRMLQQEFALVEFPVGSAGLEGKRDLLLSRRGEKRVLLSTCMVQHHPSTGRPLFLHNNLNKFSFSVPPYWSKYARRWRVVTPPKFSFLQHAGEETQLVPVTQRLSHLGYDPEEACYGLLMELRCAKWFARYTDLMRARGAREDVLDWSGGEQQINSFVLDDHITGMFKPYDGDVGMTVGEAGARGEQLTQHGLMRGITPHMTTVPAASFEKLEKAFRETGGKVPDPAAFQKIASNAGVSMVTAYVWWDGHTAHRW